MAAGSELARGIDEREVDADQQVQQVSAETTFSEDVRLEALGEPSTAWRARSGTRR